MLLSKSESEKTMTNPNPEDALAMIEEARAGATGSLKYPIGYDILYGSVCALLVSAQGLPQPWPMPVLAVAMAGLVWMIMAWRRRFGWWVSGYSPDKARWVAFAMVAVFLGLIALTLYGRHEGPKWLFLVSGGLGFVASIGGSRLWMRVWRSELNAGMK